MAQSRRRQRWYAIAAPIQGVYDSYERCQQELRGVPGARRGPVEVSSEEEGWAVLNGGIRLPRGLYAFTDATAIGGVGVVFVRMPVDENAVPQILEPTCSSSVVQILDAKPIGGIDAAQVVEALGRLRNILAEMVALYEALSQLLVRADIPAGSEITIVHDYFGVSAWMQAGASLEALVRIDPGYYDASFKKHAWAPAKDPIISAVIAACWDLALSKQLRLVFRHQPGHRSEAAGEHHFVRFNRMADELADQGSEPPSSVTS